MNYESAAYDNRDENNPTFYMTVDESNGPSVKFTPDATAVQVALQTNNFSNLLHTTSPTVKYEYFKVTPINSNGAGTFEWTTNIRDGRASASSYHIKGEGIDIRNG